MLGKAPSWASSRRVRRPRSCTRPRWCTTSSRTPRTGRRPTRTSTQIGGLPDELPLKVGDTWYEGGPEGGDKVTTWHVAIAMRPTLFVFTSVGRLRHDRNGDGGREGRITVQYHFTCPGPDITLFTRTMTIEAYRY